MTFAYLRVFKVTINFNPKNQALATLMVSFSNLVTVAKLSLPYTWSVHTFRRTFVYVQVFHAIISFGDIEEETSQHFQIQALWTQDFKIFYFTHLFNLLFLKYPVFTFAWYTFKNTDLYVENTSHTSIQIIFKSQYLRD